MNIVTIHAGLGDPSTTKLLATKLATETKVQFGDETSVRVIGLRGLAHPIADALLTGFPSGDLAEAINAVDEAEALILVTPTFQASYSGLFKSFMDLLSADQLRGKPVLLAATGGTERHSLVIEHALRPLVSYLGMLSVPTGVYAATSDFGSSSQLEPRITRAVTELADLMSNTAGFVRGSKSTVGETTNQNTEEEFGADLVPFETMLSKIGG